MATPEKTYIKEIARALGYYAIWLPTYPLEIGDYGLFHSKYLFVRLGNIKDLGITFNIRKDKSTASMQFESADAVTMNVVVGADQNLPNTPIVTKVVFTFSRENAVVFKANGIRSFSVQDQVALGKNILNLLKEGNWDKKHRIITELIGASSTTVIISGSKSSSLELMAQGNLSSIIDIADAKLGLTILKKSAMAYSDIAKSGLTPLFRTSGIRTTGLLKRHDNFSPLRAIKGVAALDYITNKEIKDCPEALYFGLDDVRELLRDDE
jgi:hypothetical protein